MRPRRLLALAVALIIPVQAAAQATDDVTYYHLDALGSVRAITDANQQVVATYDYLPFGEAWPNAGTSTNTRRFASKERDAATEFEYFGARYYASGDGRFTTVDPGHVNGDLYDPQSWNGYAYARNNPFRYSDSDGRRYEICASGGWSCGSVSDQYFAVLERNPGSGIRLWGGAIFAGNRIAGSYRQTSIDPTFGDFARLTGGLASRWLREQSTQMAVGATIAATGGLATGALSGGLAVQEVLGIGRLVASTLEGTFGASRAAVVRQVIAGKQPVSALTAEERTLAAAYYRSVAGRTVGTYASDASRYNIARAEFLEGTRSFLSKTLPEFIKNGFQ